MVLESIFPVFALIAAGAVLRRYGLTSAAFLQTGDRLVYYAFFPALLFWKVGGTPTDAAVPWRLWTATAGVIVAMWLISLFVIAVGRIDGVRAGAFSQATIRFNTYVAIAVVFNAQGDTGVARLGELLGVAIPVVNVLAVMTFIWFSRRSLTQRTRVSLTLRAVIRNPLILACVAGMIWARLQPAWPVVMDNTLRLASSFTLPFALISIGGSLTATGLRRHARLATVTALLKLVLLPFLGWVALRGAGVTGPALLTGMLFFAMPASTAMYVLTVQMDGDADLSSAVIVLTTALSLVSLATVLLVFS